MFYEGVFIPIALIISVVSVSIYIRVFNGIVSIFNFNVSVYIFTGWKNIF